MLHSVKFWTSKIMVVWESTTPRRSLTTNYRVEECSTARYHSECRLQGGKPSFCWSPFVCVLYHVISDIVSKLGCPGRNSDWIRFNIDFVRTVVMEVLVMRFIPKFVLPWASFPPFCRPGFIKAFPSLVAKFIVEASRRAKTGAAYLGPLIKKRRMYMVADDKEWVRPVSVSILSDGRIDGAHI